MMESASGLRLCLSALAILVFSVAACSEDNLAPFELPELSTGFALFGTASEGRPLRPSSIRVVDVEQADGLRPEFIAGGNVDVVWAGLQAEDLVDGLTPPSITFVRGDAANGRPIPRLYTPHILQMPSSPDTPEALVPVNDEALPRSAQQERQFRFESMLEDIAIADPCSPPRQPWSVNTPRISSESALSARVMSDGTTVLGLATTSTAVLGVVPADALEVDLIGVGVVEDLVPMGTLARVRYLDGDEVRHPSGALVPSAVAISVQVGLGLQPAAMVWRQGNWRDATPISETLLPRIVRGVRRIDLDGVPSLCVFGGAQGGLRPAAIWCRPQSGGEWSIVANFDARFGISNLTALDDGSLLATDVGGSVYRRAGSNWQTLFDIAANRGCEPLCVTLELTTPLGTGSNFAAWLAGDQAQLLRVVSDARGIVADVPTDLESVLFSDERFGAELPSNFLAMTESPDGALWLATDRGGALIRRAPDGSYSRVCLPDSFKNVLVGAISANEQGRLLIAGSPVLLAETAW